MDRGMLTEEVQAKARAFLKRDITKTELRLYPYMDYCLKNCGYMNMTKITHDELEIVKLLTEEGHIEYNGRLHVTKEFYNFMNEILWDLYVETKL